MLTSGKGTALSAGSVGLSSEQVYRERTRSGASRLQEPRPHGQPQSAAEWQVSLHQCNSVSNLSLVEQ